MPSKMLLPPNFGVTPEGQEVLEFHRSSIFWAPFHTRSFSYQKREWEIWFHTNLKPRGNIVNWHGHILPHIFAIIGACKNPKYWRQLHHLLHHLQPFTHNNIDGTCWFRGVKTLENTHHVFMSSKFVPSVLLLEMVFWNGLNSISWNKAHEFHPCNILFLVAYVLKKKSL